jgi:hypothetical protein
MNRSMQCELSIDPRKVVFFLRRSYRKVVVGMERKRSEVYLVCSDIRFDSRWFLYLFEFQKNVCILTIERPGRGLSINVSPYVIV